MSPVQRQENGRLGRDFSDGIPFDFDGDGDGIYAAHNPRNGVSSARRRGFKDPLDNTLVHTHRIGRPQWPSHTRRLKSR